MLVGVDQFLATAAAHGDRNDFLGQDAVLLRSHGTLVRCHRELVLLAARDAVLAAQVFRGLHHPARHRIVPTTGGATPARQPIVYPHAAAGTAPSHIGGVERHVAHAFGSAGDDEIIVAR